MNGQVTAFGPLTSMGVPVNGLLTQGNSYFVAPRTGANGNAGNSANQAYQTIATAVGVMSAGQNDVVYLEAQGNTASDTTDYQSATLAWSKNNTHLIGITSPIFFSQRARIAQLSTATGVSPLVNISGSGCIWKNVSVFQGVNDVTSLIAVTVSGDRNYFENCHFAGGGNATQTASANMRSLKLTGSENVFRNCVIGLDTVARSTSNAEFELAAGSAAATRNKFIDCMFVTYASSAAHLFMLIAASGIDRFVEFERCTFINPIKSAATPMTTAFTVSGSAGGLVLLKECTLIGATHFESSVSGNVFVDGAAPTAATSGLAVVVA